MCESVWIDEDGVIIPQEEVVAKIRKRYLKNVPAGYSKKKIQNMSDEDLLDMDYFLNE